MKTLIILSMLVMACGSNLNATVDTYQMKFQDVCEVTSVDGIDHIINCQGQSFVVYYYFEPPDIPFVVGDHVLADFIFENILFEDKETFKLIDVLFVDTEQPEDNDVADD